MKTLTSFFNRVVQRYLPDALLFAIILTFLVYLLGVFFTDNSPVDMVTHWGLGFWDLLEFTMQMTLVVVTGYILANTPVIKRFLAKVSTFARTPAHAVMLVTIVSLIACLINYGFGLVIGALFAIHVAKHVPSVDYRILIASAYSGFLIWHGGFSGSIPLTIATPGHFLEESMGVIPVTKTLFSPTNLFIVIALLITLPLFNRYLLKNAESLLEDRTKWVIPNEEAAAVEHVTPMTPAEKLENSRTISLIIGIMGIAFIVYHFAVNGFNLNINIVNFIFLFLGILLHQTPKRFLDTVANGVKNAGGIIIQFPFYAGIMGMMIHSGLSEQIALWFVSVSTEQTLPYLSFLSAGLINIFVPSGGGQWAVQGPIMIQAAMELGADPAKTAMGVAWGDAWTNMIQPFWALPILAIAGLHIRDIMGFCVMILIFSFIPISIGFLLF
ncbi:MULTISPECIES: short-chain fatty acid transporter [Aeribacillus]|uniref:short-chain fatty acid transporter n=1 Tax=Aeribacillus TaxID=1055323 RepID=UPI0007B49B37|nr:MULTISPECIES: short-chain fatty acid transporter [Aeribacillus]KZM54580.1 short-chain fatty acid transporter [Aeribacillus pallidus]MED0651373.1 short-chain fatty acid transporter [Aeribacillus composti]MED4487297.1 short-chain fatty acid transporter [Aeribacillus pallidus]